MELEATDIRKSRDTPIVDMALQAPCLILAIAGTIQIADASDWANSIRLLVAIPLCLAAAALFTSRNFVNAWAFTACMLVGLLTLFSLGFGTILLPLGILTLVRHNRRCDRFGSQLQFESGIQFVVALVAAMAMFYVLATAL